MSGEGGKPWAMNTPPQALGISFDAQAWSLTLSRDLALCQENSKRDSFIFFMAAVSI